jgi:hypothetical protein
MSTEQVREFCTTELQDFLKEGALSPQNHIDRCW